MPTEAYNEYIREMTEEIVLLDEQARWVREYDEDDRHPEDDWSARAGFISGSDNYYFFDMSLLAVQARLMELAVTV
jgi:hypothetical protein